MHISSKTIITKLGNWFGYTPCSYQPIYQDVNEKLKELDDSFNRNVYENPLKPCQCVRHLNESIEDFNCKISSIIHPNEADKDADFSRNKRS